MPTAARMAAHSGAPPFAPPNQSQPPVMPPMQMQMNAVAGGGPVHGGPPGLQFDPMGFAVKANDKGEESAEAKLERKRKQDAERKKKEDEEKAKQQAAKQQDKSRPVSSTPIGGTPWCVVWTGDGRVFFYNPSSRTSVWERPEELLGRADVDEAVASTPDQAGNTNNTAAATKDDKPNQQNSVNTNNVTSLKRSESESSGENYDLPNKKLKTVETAGMLQKRISTNDSLVGFS